MAEPETLYKLMILYMLKKVNFPLSNPQLWTFFDEKGYTNYFTFQETTQQLLDSGLIFQDEVHNTVRYELTQEGEEVLFYFARDISQTIREEIDSFITANKFQLRNETGITSDYYRVENQDFSGYEYCAHCEVREGRSKLFEINLTVPTEDQAKQLCTHWEENAQQIYAYVMKQLM